MIWAQSWICAEILYFQYFWDYFKQIMNLDLHIFEIIRKIIDLDIQILDVDLKINDLDDQSMFFK